MRWRGLGLSMSRCGLSRWNLISMTASRSAVRIWPSSGAAALSTLRVARFPRWLRIERKLTSLFSLRASSRLLYAGELMATPLQIVVPSDPEGDPVVTITMVDYVPRQAGGGTSPIYVDGFGVDQNGAVYYAPAGGIDAQRAELAIDSDGDVHLYFGRS